MALSYVLICPVKVVLPGGAGVCTHILNYRLQLYNSSKYYFFILRVCFNFSDIDVNGDVNVNAVVDADEDINVNVNVNVDVGCCC